MCVCKCARLRDVRLVIMIIGERDHLTRSHFSLSRKGDPHYVPFTPVKTERSCLKSTAKQRHLLFYVCYCTEVFLMMTKVEL